MTGERHDNELLELSRAVSDYPGRLAPRLSLARLFYEQGDFEHAMSLLQEGLFYLGNNSQDLLSIAEAMVELDALPDAIACLQTAVRGDPSNGHLYAALAKIWARLGELEKASGFALRAKGFGVSCDLSAYSDGPTVEMTRHLFDQYAGRFDSHLENLDYCVPEELARMLGPHLFGNTDLSVLDLGCGTGLMAPLLKAHAKRLVGVDLSSKMLAEAARLDLYDELHTGDIVDYLAQHQSQFDLIVAADVLVYLGDLEPLLRVVGMRLMPGGIFVASIEFTEQASYQLNDARRYSHNPEYIRQLAGTAGLALEILHQIVPRTDRGKPVDGRIFLLSKPMKLPA